MRYLKIENNKGYFLKDSTQPDVWTEIDQIEKEDLMKLLDFATKDEEFDIEPYKEESLANKAHQIIYKHIYEKFTIFLSNKDRFVDEASNLYKSAIEKYS